MNTITQYNPSINFKAAKYEYKIDSQFNDDNAKKNFLSAKTINAKNRIYMVAPSKSSEDYIFMNSMYEFFYKPSGFILANLTKQINIIEDKLKTNINMEDGPHTINTGGLIKSIAIGQWLNEFYKLKK